MKFFLTFTIVLFTATASLAVEKTPGPGKEESAADGDWRGDVYPLATCPVSGQKLGSMGDPVVYEHEGREIRFCCGGCVEPFKKESAEYLKKIDAKIVEQQVDRYPLDTCVVSGEKLGEMGDPYDYVHKNRLVRLCCPGCKSRFQADPAKYIEKIDQAVIKKQKEDYPLETCVVSGQKLGAMGDPVDYVEANRLVEFCCPGCISTFEKNPLKYMTAIDEAAGE
jgi:YHS domain-containing protein